MWIAQRKFMWEKVPPPAYGSKSTKNFVIGFIQKGFICFIS
jgi:hypothetical protein